MKKENFFNDHLWKVCLKDLFLEFLEMCHPKLHKRVDKSKPVEFFDKELHRIFPQKGTKKRHADLLAKVHLKGGGILAIIAHTEAQGYPDPTFAYRMEVYNYRAHDHYGLDVESIALLTDSDPDFRPTEYRHKVVKTERVLKFHAFKLLDHPPKELQGSRKLFSIALETAWYALRQNKLDDDHLMEVKRDLLRRLVRRRVSRSKIETLMGFLQMIVSFEKPENEAKFGAELNKVSERIKSSAMTAANSQHPMSNTLAYWIQVKDEEMQATQKKHRVKLEAERQKAEAERQKAEAATRRAVQALLLQNVSLDYLCEILQVTKAYVLQVKKEMEMGEASN